MENVPRCLPLGRLSDLKQYSCADRIAVKPGRGVFDDWIVKVYPSRKSLETFLRNPGEWRALVKTPVGKNMVAWPAYQREAAF